MWNFVPKLSLSLLEQSSESEQKVRVQFAITSLTASVGMKGPCTKVSAAIGDAIIRDCAVKSTVNYKSLYPCL